MVDQIDVDDGDFQCEVEIKPCAEDPEQALCKYRRQVDVFRMHAKLAVGPVFARHIGNRMYRGEYYAMQSDAHVTYTQDWDVDIIGQQEATGDEMAVQTTYLTDIVDSIDEETGKSLRKTRPIMCNTDYEGGAQGKHLRHMSQPERIPSITGMPQLEPYWAAGFSFSRGHFIVNVPYDQYQPMIFQGEEMSMGIRGLHDRVRLLCHPEEHLLPPLRRGSEQAEARQGQDLLGALEHVQGHGEEGDESDCWASST